MPNIIKIKEEANRLYYDYKMPIVCGNTNYVIKFDFGEDWADVTTKTAVFEVAGKKIYCEFTGDTLNMPAMPNAYTCKLTLLCSIGDDEAYQTETLPLFLSQSDLGMEVETMDPFKGYYTSLLNSIKKCESGEITVQSATTAGTANYATTAGNATTAGTANYATTAGSATTAGTATFATTAGTSQTQVSLSGDESISGQKNFTGLLKKNNEVVPNVKQVSNENLLLNGDFSVNQRNETSYSGENVYSVDRWKLGNELATATENSDGSWSFGISDATSAGEREIVMQTVENYKTLLGEKVTASISYSLTSEDVAGQVKLSIYDGVSSTGVTLSATNTSAVVSHTISSSATKLSVILHTTSTGKNCMVKINWCKLEVGENATLFVPRHPAEELWLCQRYYQDLKLEGQTGTILLTSTFLPVIILNNCMRTTPTMTMVKDPIILGNGVNYTVNASYFSKINYNLVQIALQIYRETAEDPVLPIWDLCVLRNGNMTLDAEIY